MIDRRSLALSSALSSTFILSLLLASPARAVDECGPLAARLRRSFNDIAKERGLGGAFSEVVAPDYAKSGQRLNAFNKIAKEVSQGKRPPPTFGELERLRQGLRGAVTGQRASAGTQFWSV